MKKCILFFTLLGLSLLLNAQSDKELLQAFTQSYKSEADSNYTAGIAFLESVYQKDSYELNLRLGWLCYLNGNYPGSINYYKKARQLMPYSFEARLGYVLPVAAMGNWDEVIMVYEEILEVDPQNTWVNYRMGVIYYERKNYEKAYQYTEKVVNLYPFDFDSVVLLAWINLKMEKLREAKVLFNKALLIIPEHPSAMEGLQLIK